MIIEDNPVNLKLVRVLLEAEHHEVRAVTDAAEALEVLKTFHPLMIMMDIQLPDMDGLELTRRLKSDPSTRDILIVAITAYAMKGDAEKMRAAGCVAYVSKPIDTRGLGALVARLLSEHRVAAP